VVEVGGSAFFATGTGPGLMLFVGSRFSSFTSLRGGLAVSTHSEAGTGDRATVLSIFVETYFQHILSDLTLQVGPRFVAMQRSRTPLVGTQRGFGAGAVGGARLSLAARSSVEGGVSFTMVSFGAADRPGLPDPNRRSSGRLWDIRLCFVYDFE